MSILIYYMVAVPLKGFDSQRNDHLNTWHVCIKPEK